MAAPESAAVAFAAPSRGRGDRGGGGPDRGGRRWPARPAVVLASRVAVAAALPAPPAAPPLPAFDARGGGGSGAPDDGSRDLLARAAALGPGGGKWWAQCVEKVRRRSPNNPSLPPHTHTES